MRKPRPRVRGIDFYPVQDPCTRARAVLVGRGCCDLRTMKRPQITGSCTDELRTVQGAPEGWETADGLENLPARPPCILSKRGGPGGASSTAFCSSSPSPRNRCTPRGTRCVASEARNYVREDVESVVKRFHKSKGGQTGPHCGGYFGQEIVDPAH